MAGLSFVGNKEFTTITDDINEKVKDIKIQVPSLLASIFTNETVVGDLCTKRVMIG